MAETPKPSLDPNQERQPILYPLEEMMEVFAHKFLLSLSRKKRSDAVPLLRELLDLAYRKGLEDMYKAAQDYNNQKVLEANHHSIEDLLLEYLRLQGRLVTDLEDKEKADIESVAYNFPVEVILDPLPSQVDLMKAASLEDRISHLLPSLRMARTS